MADQNQKDYGTSEVDARQGSTDQSIKDINAQETNLNKQQYPEVLEDSSLQSKGDKPDESGTSEVDAKQESQGMKDKNAQETNLYKEQYPEVLENPSVGSAEARSEARKAGSSEKSA